MLALTISPSDDKASVGKRSHDAAGLRERDVANGELSAGLAAIGIEDLRADQIAAIAILYGQIGPGDDEAAAAQRRDRTVRLPVIRRGVDKEFAVAGSGRSVRPDVLPRG